MARVVCRLAIVMAMLAAVRALAQPGPPGPDMTIDAAMRAAVVEGAAQHLIDYYVFPDVGAKMAAAIRDHQQRRDYDAITTARAFAERLTADLREVSHDKHLSVLYSANVFPPPPSPNAEPTPEELERARGVMV